MTSRPEKLEEEGGLVRIPDLDDVWSSPSLAGRARDVVRIGARVRDRIRESGVVRRVDTCDLVTIPYPLRYGLLGATWLPWPFLWMVHRMLVVHYRSRGGDRLLLVNPTDVIASRQTPFFARMARRWGAFLSYRVLTVHHGTVAGHLARLGLRPEDVDEVTFDHLHTQDLRAHLGGPEPLFPRARLLVQRAELEIARDLHPLQRDWYIAGSVATVDPSRIRVLEGDYLLGEGVALVRTPGHTGGNHSICLNTPAGLYTISENGVSPDSYAPTESAIPGLRRHAQDTGLEVVLNGNTLEGSLDQYTSMLLERTLADPLPGRDGFRCCFPSSELTSCPLAPGLRPTVSIRSLDVASG